PNMVEKKLDNKIAVPNVLSFLTYQNWNQEIAGMDQFKEEDMPNNVPMLYYSYHIMVGLGTIFIGIMALSLFFLYRKKLFNYKPLLWFIMFLVPFPYIANLLGWYVAELGRQPYLVYGLLRTSAGVSPTVSSGNTLFTLLGFMGLYFLLGLLFLILVGKTINQGPKPSKL
ncbi:MAG: cytochrome ubiquinol oxidase subunit I, partial [Lutibacter sp.]